MKVIVNGLAWLDKNDLNAVQLETLKRTLTVMPRKGSDYPGEEPKPIFLYDETDTHIGIARGFFEENRRPVHEVVWDVSDGRKDLWGGDFVSAISPRAEQLQALDVVSARFRSGALGGIVRAVPGWGKTVYACALMERMQVPTMIVVHKEFLMDQWKERIEQFLPGTKIGIVQQDVCDYVGKSVVIAMVHSLAAKNYPKEFYEWAGLIVVDECHRIGAYTWAPVPQRFNARWRLGLSATPKRKDGADDVLAYHLGPLLFAAKEKRLLPKVKRVWTNFKLVKTDRFNPNLAKKGLVLRFLCGSAMRNRLIVDQIIKATQAGRKVIVLSERIAHLEMMERMFHEMWPNAYGAVPSTDYYIGGRSKQQLEFAKEARVIFATTQYASEGLDIPELDTLLLTTPMSDVEQAVGRILRPHPDKKEPIVVDFRDDDVPVCARAGKSRDKYYDQLGS